MLVFVVDSVDRSRLLTARQELHALLAAEPRLPLVVLANKQVGVCPSARFQRGCPSLGPRGEILIPKIHQLLQNLISRGLSPPAFIGRRGCCYQRPS